MSVVFASSHPLETRIFADHFSGIPKLAGKTCQHIVFSATGSFPEGCIQTSTPLNFFSELDRILDVAQLIIFEASLLTATYCESRSERREKTIFAVFIGNPQQCIPPPGCDHIRKICSFVQKVLVANIHLGNPLPLKDHQGNTIKTTGKIVPIGFSLNVAESPQIKFLTARGITAPNPVIMAYIGGANDQYFDQALPLFVSFMSHLQDPSFPLVCVIIRHPRSKNLQEVSAERADLEIAAIQGLKRTLEKKGHFLTEGSVKDAEIADLVAYHQSTVSIALGLQGQHLVQVGDGDQDDLLCANEVVPAVKTAEELFAELTKAQEKRAHRQKITESLGASGEWQDRLRQFLFQPTC